MKCQYENCKREAKYYMCWVEGNDKKCGMVCSTHDRRIGRHNLINAGMTLNEAIRFDIDKEER